MQTATVNYVFIILVHVTGAFAKMRKATINFVMLFRLCVRMGHLGSHRTDFYDNLCMFVF